jgi:hypothetical protein
MNDAITAYAQALDPQRAAICNRLQQLIDAGLPNAASKMWHAIPVWFVGENAVVGYTARKQGVVLMFWNGEKFDEPELEHTGSFHVGQIGYDDVAQIDEAKMARWLQKAGTNIWDMVGERNAFVAKRRAAKAKAKMKAKPKAKAKPKSKVKSKAKAKVKRAKAKRAKSKK